MQEKENPPKHPQLQHYINNLCSENNKERLHSVQNIHLIAKAFGKARTEKELIPFLRNYRNDEENIMLSLCDQLRELALFISEEKPKKVNYVIPWYYIVFSYEDLSVLEKGVSSLKELLSEKEFIDKSLMVLVVNLYQSGHLKQQISSILLLCQLVSFVPPNYHQHVKQILGSYVDHEAIVLRKYLARELRSLLNRREFMEMALRILTKLLEDTQDIVRVCALESLVVTVYEDKQFFVKNVLQTIFERFNDENWKLRMVICQNVDVIIKNTNQYQHGLLLQKFVGFMQDKDAEVLKLAVKKIQHMHAHFSEELVRTKILPKLQLQVQQQLQSQSRSEIDAFYLQALLCVSHKLPADFVTAQVVPLQARLIEKIGARIANTSVLSLQTQFRETGDPRILQIIRQFLENVSAHRNWVVRFKAPAVLRLLV